ncbi:MAG: P-loop NTPase, partial [bacterium]|nr:P-loop NTPase [bacterium]
MASLTRMLERKLVIVSGKGGVGKSAVTIALAIRAQRAGKRVLVSAMTDEVGSAIRGGTGRLAYKPAEFQGGIGAMAVQRAEALEEYLKVQLGVPQAAP